MPRSGRLIERVRAAAFARADVASLAAFRIIFGAVMAIGLVRFLATGWIVPMYGEPKVFFTYPGFDWVRPWSVTGMYVHYLILVALAVMIMLGAYTRVALIAFTLGFAYTQLVDVTNYLNHHYLVVLLGGLLACLPVNAAWSIDARRDPGLSRATIPAWMVWLLRFQVGVVYVFAGLAKAKLDWLGHGQPLNLWLAARTETPILGPLFDEPWVALAMSWMGFLFDTTIVVWLSWRRTRIVAYVALIVFHGLTGYLFNIGMFPLIMTSAALIFFPPAWPRTVLRALGKRAWAEPGVDRVRAPVPAWRRTVVGAALVVHVLLQLGLPLRRFAYGGNVLWTEQGMQLAWHVMIREKHGAVTYVATFADGKRLEIPPSNYLTARQERELGGQPALIAQLAGIIGRDLEARGYRDFGITARAWVSLNGRAPAAMIDPTGVLYRAGVGLQDPSAGWILAAPAGAPGHVAPID